jgi:hypothetical protein
MNKNPKLNLNNWMTVIVIRHDYDGIIYIDNGEGEPITPKELIKELQRIEKTYNEQTKAALKRAKK